MLSSAVVVHPHHGLMICVFLDAFLLTQIVKSADLSYCIVPVDLNQCGHFPVTSKSKDTNRLSSQSASQGTPLADLGPWAWT